MNVRAILKYGLIVINLLAIYKTQAVITTLSRNDPVPPYTTDNPFAFLGTPHYEYLKGREKLDTHKHLSIEILPFYQRASRGNDSCGCTTELGDISGRWNMIALLPFNFATDQSTEDHFPIIYTSTNTDLPCSKKYPQVLINIRNELLSDLQDIVNPASPEALPPELKTVEGLLDLQYSTTANNGNLGYFAVPMKYKKSGVRFNAELYIGKGIGFTMQAGIATIDQCATFTDRTQRQYAIGGNPFNPLARNTDAHLSRILTATWNWAILQKISTDLMSKLDAIVSSTEINYSLCTFHNTSMEDLHGELFWKYPAQINKDETDDKYPKFLFVPFFAIGGTYAISNPQNSNFLLSLPFGNNCHSAARVRGGFSLDFYDTVDVNFEVGVTAFKNRVYCNMPMPTNAYQHPIYPFRTDVRVCPGKNWHIALGMTAHNFWYNWSSSFHYIYVNHDKDTISLLCNNIAAGRVGEAETCRGNIHPYRPDVLECISKWTVQVFDWSLNYAIAPDFSIGGLIQIPLKRKNAYRSSTFMLSLFINV